MRWLIPLCLLPAVAAAEPPAKYAAAIKALEVLIEKERQEAGIPGMSVAIVEGEAIIWAKGFGHADLAKTKPATADTVYRVGSVSKVFTDLAVMQLVDEGKLDLDKPVSEYLPDFKPENTSKTPITLRQLMSHRSGLVREPPAGSYFESKPPSLEQTVASLNGVPLVYDPGEQSKFSNAGIAVVGRVVEKVDGRPFTTAVRDRVLVPLKMTASAFEPTTEVKKLLAEGMMWTYHGREFRAPTFELGIAPAGCMYSNVTDLGRFAALLSAEGKGVLKRASFREMVTPQYAGPGASDGVGLGLSLMSLDGRRCMSHAGAVYGFASDVVVLPEEKIGVVIVASKDAVNSLLERIANRVVRSILAAKASLPPPADDPVKAVTTGTAREFAGKYGRWPTHELFEMGGRLYHLGPDSEVINEVFVQGNGFVSRSPIDGGVRFTCDGKSIPAGKSEAFARQPDVRTAPPDPPVAARGLIGEYGWDHNTLFVFEKDGRLCVLIEWFFLYPLDLVEADTYRFPKTYGLYHGEQIRFRRDAEGKGREAIAGGVRFPRRTLDGEDGKLFRIKPLKTMDVLRGEADAAKPPGELGEFRKPDLVELVALDPTIKTDLRYASDNNFMGRPLYPKTAKAYMQRPAAEAVVKANAALAKKGYGLWVFDAYRPWRVTKMFWEATPDPLRTFVADPSKGSRHNRGCAVDLTLYDLKTGKPVEMVSGYDEFSDRAYPNYWGGTSRQRWHRELLRHTMEDAGFRVYEAEWWHFDFKDWRAYRIGNQGFEELSR